MYLLSFYLIIGLVLALLFFNIYFRFKIFKLYRYLINNRIQFDAKHMLNIDKLHEEILPKYPEHRDKILSFVKRVRFSITLACILFVLVVLFGLILKYTA